jgi:purine-binding chemotaxis protein CheW
MADKKAFVSFRLGEELYGLDIMDVKEIIHLSEITPIPNSPDFVDGIINLRGKIIPIVDLGKRFNFVKKELTEEEELLKGIIIINVNKLLIGIIIDQVNRVLSIEESQIQPPPQMISGIGTEFVQGVSKIEEQNDELLILLNIKKLFNRSELLLLSGKT